MSLKYIFLILLLTFITSKAQFWKAGADLSLGLASGPLEYQYGPGLTIEYSPGDIPFALQGNGRFTFAASALKFTTRTLGGRILWYPFKHETYSVKPYIGFGALHNWYHISEQGASRIITDIKDNVSFELSVGFILNPRSYSSNYIFEFAFQHNKPEYYFKYGPNNFYDPNAIHTGRYDFGTVYFKIGMLFR